MIFGLVLYWINKQALDVMYYQEIVKVAYGARIRHMTSEELEELKEVGRAVALGERSSDEFYELLELHADELIQAYECALELYNQAHVGDGTYICPIAFQQAVKMSHNIFDT